MKKIITLLLILLSVLPQVKAEEVLYDTYRADNGIIINSYTENWTGDKLSEVYDELLNNAHGEELNYLKEINLYGDNPSGGVEEGVYNGLYKNISIFGKKKIALTKECNINLYNLKNKSNVKEFAKTLSHEYGHHFTLYYLIKGENKTFEDWKETNLYKYRQVENYDEITNNYDNGHKWSIIEICAEDYVQLYGSSNAKDIVEFQDIYERYKSNTLNNSVSYNYGIYNINPQENNEIPLVIETEGLKEYWEYVSGINSNVNYCSRPALALVDVVNLSNDKYQYVFEWTKSYDSDGNTAESYTLVATDLEKNNIVPIKTVNKDELMQGIMGSVRFDENNAIMYYTDSFIEPSMILKVYANFNNGSVISSQELHVDFKNPETSDLKVENEKVDSSYELQFQDDTQSVFSKITNFIFDIIAKILYQV